MSVIPLNDLSNLLKKSSKTQRFHKTLKDLKWSNDHIVLLIIPCFYDEKQAKDAQKMTSELVADLNAGNFAYNVENLNIHSATDYPQIILKAKDLVQEIPEKILGYFYPLNLTLGDKTSEIVAHRHYCFDLFEDCPTFSREKAYNIKYTEENGKIDLLDQKELFLKFCQENPFKLSVLFLDPLQINWLSEFLRDYRKGEAAILPGIKVLTVKIK